MSVGAVDGDLTIESFSSPGPTADNRIKPDLCAQGVQVAIPDIYSSSQGDYTSGMGTSYAAPVVAGALALVVQNHPADSAAATRERLYSSCFFVPGQTAMDNTYGRGIPDALLACVAYNQTYITVSDSLALPVAEAGVTSGDGVVAGKSDSLGYAILNLSGRFPETLTVEHPLYKPAQVIIPSRHSRMSVVVRPKYVLTVFLKDTAGNPVPGTVYWKVDNAQAFSSAQTDSTGFVRLIPSAARVEVFGESGGYYGSDHVVVHLTGETKSITLLLKPRPASQFVIFPNVLNLATKKQHLTCTFVASPDNPRKYSQLFKAAIRSIDGTLIWSYWAYLEEEKPNKLTWPESGRTVAPGIYYFIITYEGKIYKQKFLVIG